MWFYPFLTRISAVSQCYRLYKITVYHSGNLKEQVVVITSTLIITIYIFLSSVRLDAVIIGETFSLLSRDVWLVSSQGFGWTL